MLGSAVAKVEPIATTQTVTRAMAKNNIVRIDRLKRSNIGISPGLNFTKTKSECTNSMGSANGSGKNYLLVPIEG